MRSRAQRPRPLEAVARKPAPGKRAAARTMDRSLERQAEEATTAALHGEVNVSRVLTPAPTARMDLPASSGEALPTALRAEAEQAFGADLSAVRVHRDPAAATAAAHEEARAFTAGRDIYFAEGQWAPTAGEGQKLLYHELAHVLQQTGRRLSVTEIRATDREGTGPVQRRGGKRHG